MAYIKEKIARICILAVIGLLSSVHGARNVSVEYNPGCVIPSCSDPNLSVHLIYAKSQDNADSYHYVISSIGPSFPTVLLFKSDHSDATIDIDWEKLLSLPFNDSQLQGAISLVDDKSRKPYNDTPQTAVYFFSQILGYSDKADNVDINDPSNVNQTILDLDGLQWNVKHTNNSAIFVGTDNSSSIFGNDTWLGLKFLFHNSDGREVDLPRLAFNDKSAKMELIFKNFNANFSNPRFALKVHVANPQNSSESLAPSTNGCLDKISTRSIDDEYAPSVFTSTEVMWKICGSESQENFWHWRAVCYTQPTPVRKFSTDVKSVKMMVMDRTNSTAMLQRNRLLLSYYGRQNLEQFLFNSTTISFGKPEDDFYSATNYLSWTTLIGFGAPPGDSLSLTVIAILLAGVVLPLIVIIGGGIYMAVRKYKRRSSRKAVIDSQYQPIG